MTEICTVIYLVFPDVVILFSSDGKIDFRKRRVVGYFEIKLAQVTDWADGYLCDHGKA
jgi:hypothetical protein